MKRLISANTSDILKMSASELKQSIKASEGRTILSENIVTGIPIVPGVTNSEIAKAYGADLILLNLLDVFNPQIEGLELEQDYIKQLKKLVGRPIGVNLEPVDDKVDMIESKVEIAEGRKATEETLKKIEAMGFDFVCLTGNPGTGVSNSKIIESVKLAKKHFSGLIIAGKMHGAGSNEAVIDKKIIKDLIKAGIDILLVPAIGTIQGFDKNDLKNAVIEAHKNDTLVMSAIGTSQESADKDTIKYIALQNKMCGVDIQHLGDAGYGGLALCENIYETSKVIRGLRHTVSVISRSINR